MGILEHVRSSHNVQIIKLLMQCKAINNYKNKIIKCIKFTNVNKLCFENFTKKINMT